MSKKTTKPTETQEVQEMQAEEIKTEETAAKEPVAAEADTEETAKETGSVVYCGPSVRGVVKQYTVFAGEIPELLKTFLSEHPIASGLIVDIDRFPETRKALGIKGSAEAVLYDKIRKEI